MNSEQRTVAIGSFSGTLLMIAMVAVTYHLWPQRSDLAEVGARLGYALQACVFAALPLLAGIITVANGRFLSEAIDPTRHKESAAMEINGRFVDNTLQQFVLFVAAVLALATHVSSSGMRVVPAVTVTFIVARAVFWLGYRIGPLYRAPGMAATAYMNVAMIGSVLWFAVSA